MTLTGEFFAFMSLALVAVIGGVLLLNLTKVIHMVVALVFTFVSIAGIYVLLSAEFLAVIQVMIYSGAITIMMLFGIMLTRHHGDEAEPKGGMSQACTVARRNWLWSKLVYFGIYDLNFEAVPNTPHENNTEQIGVSLFSQYIIPFELTSVILLVALVGAIVLARKDDEKEGDQE